VLAYLSDGRRLRTDNLRDLAGAQDQVCPCLYLPSQHAFTSLNVHQSIFVFNKYYLDEDFDEVMKLLHLQPPIQPPIEGTSPSSFTRVVRVIFFQKKR
jgi:autophagy-related protein 11